MATSTIVVPSQGTVDAEIITLATAAKADIESISAASLAATTPAALGVAATAGVAATGSKSDHVHAWAQKKTVTIGHADLTDAVAGEAQALSVDTALPASAIVLGLRVTLTTQFTGGSASAVALDIGWSGSTEALLKDLDVFGSTAGGALYDAGASAATFGMPKLASAKQLLATFTPDGAHTLDGLTAGAVTIDIYYAAAF